MGRESMLLRHVIGAVLRRMRQQQGRTLREVAETARVSVPYLSEVERGRKEASSEILAAVCLALGVSMGVLLDEASAELSCEEAELPYESVPVAPGSLPRVTHDGSREQTRAYSPDDVLAIVGPGPWVELDVGCALTTH
jgi:transcriptional regulator with XRE-family HTH domain